MKYRRRWLLIVVAIIAVAVLIYVILHGQHYFNRRTIRQLQTIINSYGQLSPLAVVLLITMSTVIPLLPLPVPLVEVAAGLVFGLWPGFLLIWASQIISSLVAFYISRHFGLRISKLFGSVFNNKIGNFYRQYLRHGGAVAVFIIRATMAAPFNIISYFAGLTEMPVTTFVIATALGTLPESFLFAFIGTALRYIHFKLWYLFLFLVLIGLVGFGLSFMMMKLLKPKHQPSTPRVSS